MQAKIGRFELRLEEETLTRIDTWRAAQADVPSRSEAVRRLVNAGLGRPEDAQVFELARFNLLCAALTEGPGARLGDAYVYAWDEGVYPLFDDAATLHKQFASHFSIPEDMVDELSKLFDDRWNQKNVPTFYELEDYYDVRGGRGFWDRSKLMRTCRYMFLHEMFDQDFWGTLLRKMDHPSEASSIIRKYDRATNIYFQ